MYILFGNTRHSSSRGWAHVLRDCRLLQIVRDGHPRGDAEAGKLRHHVLEGVGHLSLHHAGLRATQGTARYLKKMEEAGGRGRLFLVFATSRTVIQLTYSPEGP